MEYNISPNGGKGVTIANYIMGPHAFVTMGAM
jgi:hypothetical protein